AAVFFVLILATLPPLALSLLYGGVRVSQLFATGASIAASGLLVAAPAFVASAFARRTSVAVVTGYLAAVTVVAGLYVVADGTRSLRAAARLGGRLHRDRRVHARVDVAAAAFQPPRHAGLPARSGRDGRRRHGAGRRARGPHAGPRPRHPADAARDRRRQAA